VETAATAAQALALCNERAYDAVTLDLLLPDTSGLEVLRAIRRGQLNPNVPVIIVSVVSERGSVSGFAVHDYLQKPLDGSALLASLQRAGVSPGGPGAVLVVDDDAGSLRLMESALARVGFTAICRPDGPSALAAARRERPAAVVLDLMMPGMDGFQFLEELRRLPETRRTPVIVWTVKDLTADELARLRSSAQSVVAKGGGAAALLQELRVLLPAPASAAAEA
jgi:CheY-like chemotaxis protein